MAKFIKSIFSPSERRKSRFEEQDEGNDFTPPMDHRRNLSISRSGRMKQSNKKRNSLSVIIQADERFQPAEKPTSVEYHVNAPVPVADSTKQGDRVSRTTKSGDKSPEEEIDNAFEIVDKT